MSDIKKLQNTILIIANEIKRICDKYNIDYFLEGGSFLGAVRHNGFIPWDDDFDFAMKRNDYEKFLKICEKELDKSKFLIQTENNEREYCFSFAKIQLVGTIIHEDFSWNVPINHGIFVDIFPFDNLPDDVKIRRRFLEKNHLLKNMIWVKCGYGTESHKKKLTYHLVKILSFPFSIECLKKKRYKLITKYNSNKTKYMFLSDYPNTFYDSNAYQKKKKYKFEKTSFYGVENYDLILKAKYGDYMQLPPIEQRHVHTNYNIDFGIYDK